MAKYVALNGAPIEISEPWTGENASDLAEWADKVGVSRVVVRDGETTEQTIPFSNVLHLDLVEKRISVKSFGRATKEAEVGDRIGWDPKFFSDAVILITPAEFEDYSEEAQYEVETWRETLNLDHRFMYHAPTPEQIRLYEEGRDRFRELAEWIARIAPPSDEAKQAIDLIDMALMRTNAAIARHS